MDPMQTDEQEQVGPGADEVIIELLQELVQQGRAKRADSVMAPPTEEKAAAPTGDDEMAELEQMLAEPAGAQSAAPEGPGEEGGADVGTCPKCGLSTADCKC